MFQNRFFNSTSICLFACAFVLMGCKVTNSKPVHGQSEQRTFIYDGIERTYSIYLPKGIQQSHPVPLLFALHGGGGSAERWPEYTDYGFERLADRDHFILVYPNAVDGHWNDGRGVDKFTSHRKNIDDSGFLSHLMDKLASSYPIDTRRIYVTGASNGGMMAHRLAAEHSDKIAAIAAVIASIPKNLQGKLHPTHPLSVLMMNGTDDPLVPWQGGEITFGRQRNGFVTSTEQTVKFWATHNHCSTPAKTDQLPDVDPDDGTRVSRTRYSKCESGTEVVLYRISGGGHTWPGSKDKRGLIGKMLIDSMVGKKSREIDACEVIWQFFKDHPKQLKAR